MHREGKDGGEWANPTGGEWAKSMENPEEKDVPSNSCSTVQKHAPPMQEACTGVGEA